MVGGLQPARSAPHLGGSSAGRRGRLLPDPDLAAAGCGRSRWRGGPVTAAWTACQRTIGTVRPGT